MYAPGRVALDAEAWPSHQSEREIGGGTAGSPNLPAGALVVANGVPAGCRSRPLWSLVLAVQASPQPFARQPGRGLHRQDRV